MKTNIRKEMFAGDTFFDSLSSDLNVLPKQEMLWKGSGWRGRGLGLGPPLRVGLLRVQSLAYDSALSSAMIGVRILYI